MKTAIRITRTPSTPINTAAGKKKKKITTTRTQLALF